MCTEVLLEKGRSVRSIAAELGVDESTLRERLKRRAKGEDDGRKDKPEACDAHAGVIEAWLKKQQERIENRQRPESVKELYNDLVTEHEYAGTYKAVVRYVRRRTPRPKLRPKRRVEVKPGTQVQIDWTQARLNIEELGGLVTLWAFVMVLSFSRMWVVRWRLRTHQLSWLECHNESFTHLQGVPLTGRIDNPKTAVSSGAGPWGIVNPVYASYAAQLGFVVDKCLPARGDHKGKVERRGQDVKTLQVKPDEFFPSLAALQDATDERILKRSHQLVCPVTGRSVHDTWQMELEHLRPLPQTLPTPFDVSVKRRVQDDCLVNFEGRQYQVPFAYMRREVEVRGCASTVEIYNGKYELLKSYPRQTDCRILLDQSLNDGPENEHVHRPMPLGAVGEVIVLPRSWEALAPTRRVDTYEEVLRRLA